MNKKFFMSTFKKVITSVAVLFGYDDLSIVVNTSTSTAYQAWKNVIITPTDRLGCDIVVDINYSINSDSGFTAQSTCSVEYGLGDNSTTEPTWVLIDSVFDTAISSGVYSITVPDGKYLFIRIVTQIKDALLNAADTQTTVQVGSITAPCIGTIAATGGDTDTWDKYLGGI